MNDIFRDFLTRYQDHLSFDAHGQLAEACTIGSTIGTDRIIQSLDAKIRQDMPAFSSNQAKHYEFSRWILGLPEETRKACDLAQTIPPKGIHYVPGQTNLFYDFRNTDILLEELAKNDIAMAGRVLDFGCSSGRNVATLHRCFAEGVDLHGVDPAASSINWAKEAIPFATFTVNNQTPPLDYPAEHFDVVIAKSIWTHFSADAARAWFGEIARILKPGGHFFFSTHGPHDVAYRLIYNRPSPKYEMYTGSPAWTKESFLQALINGLDDNGFFFKSFKATKNQGDLSKVEDATTEDWGLAFMLPDFLQNELLPDNLEVLSRAVGRTGNRHDAYVVQKT